MKKYILALALVPALTASGAPALGAEQEEMTGEHTVASTAIVRLLSFESMHDTYSDEKGLHRPISGVFEPRTTKKTIYVVPASPSRVFSIEAVDGYGHVPVPFVDEVHTSDASAEATTEAAAAAEAQAGPKTAQWSITSMLRVPPLPTFTRPSSKTE